METQIRRLRWKLENNIKIDPGDIQMWNGFLLFRIEDNCLFCEYGKYLSGSIKHLSSYRLLESQGLCFVNQERTKKEE